MNATKSKKAGTRKPNTGNAEISVKVPLLSEVLDITRVEVDRGGYRLHKRVSTRIENVEETLTSTGVEIERRAIGTELPDGEVPVPWYDGDTLVVPVLREVLVTVKRTILVEEVRIKRVERAELHREQVPLRQEEIEIERLDAASPAALKT